MTKEEFNKLYETFKTAGEALGFDICIDMSFTGKFLFVEVNGENNYEPASVEVRLKETTND